MTPAREAEATAIIASLCDARGMRANLTVANWAPHTPWTHSPVRFPFRRAQLGTAHNGTPAHCSAAPVAVLTAREAANQPGRFFHVIFFPFGACNGSLESDAVQNSPIPIVSLGLQIKWAQFANQCVVGLWNSLPQAITEAKSLTRSQKDQTLI